METTLNNDVPNVAELMPLVSLSNNGLVSINNYKYFLHDFKIGREHNAIFLSSAAPRYKRNFFHVLMSDPLKGMISQLSIFTNSADTGNTGPQIVLNAYGLKNSNVHFLYKFENNTYKFYLYYSREMSGDIMDVVIFPITNETRIERIEDITDFEEVTI